VADDKKKASIIIKKKINKGGHGHHGGAWKVAYADFVTAMMAFFLVMWLMGADEATKSEIEHYFTHPDLPSPMGKDPFSKSSNAGGSRTGDGESILTGAGGSSPDILIKNPIQAEGFTEKLRETGDLVQEIMDGQAFNVEVEIEHLKFSLPESALFVPGTSTLTPQGQKRLDQLSNIFKNFKGFVTIEDFTDELTIDKHKRSSLFEVSIIKSVAVMDYFVKHNFVSEDLLKPLGSASSSADGNKNKSVQFTLRQDKKL
jgi:chemotaxis protein MotB